MNTELFGRATDYARGALSELTYDDLRRPTPPERLAWIEPTNGMHTTSTLTDLGDGSTEVVIHQRHVPEPMRSPEARAGFRTSLDKLERHLAHVVQGDRP